MLIPLGVLSLGAIFAGMLWYDVFFGDEAKLRAWFGMEAAVAHAAEGEAAADTHTAPATADTHAAPQGEAVATETPAAPEATPAAPEAHAAVAPKGAIYLGADNTMLHDAHYVPTWVKVSPFIAMVLGFLVAFQFYIRNPSLPGRLAAVQRPLYLFLLNKWYFDELFNFLFVRPALWLGRTLWKRGDGDVIDGSINGVALGIVPMLSRFAARLQSGYIFHYAFAMVLGIVALMTWITLSGGAH